MIRAARQPFVRALEYGDPIRQGETVGNAAFGQRTPFVQAEQSASMRAAQLAELALRGFAFHNDRQIAHSVAEAPGDQGQSPFDQFIELARIHSPLVAQRGPAFGRQREKCKMLGQTVQTDPGEDPFFGIAKF